MARRRPCKRPRALKEAGPVVNKNTRFGVIVAALTAPLAVFVANLESRTNQGLIVGAFVVAVFATWLFLRRSTVRRDN